MKNALWQLVHLIQPTIKTADFTKKTVGFIKAGEGIRLGGEITDSSHVLHMHNLNSSTYWTSPIVLDELSQNLLTRQNLTN